MFMLKMTPQRRVLRMLALLVVMVAFALMGACAVAFADTTGVPAPKSFVQCDPGQGQWQTAAEGTIDAVTLEFIDEGPDPIRRTLSICSPDGTRWITMMPAARTAAMLDAMRKAHADAPKPPVWLLLVLVFAACLISFALGRVLR